MFADNAVALAVLVIILGVGKLSSEAVSSPESPTSNGIKPSFPIGSSINMWVPTMCNDQEACEFFLAEPQFPPGSVPYFLCELQMVYRQDYLGKIPSEATTSKPGLSVSQKKSSTIHFSSCLGTDPVSLPEHQMNSLACIQWPCCRTFTQF